MTIKRMDNVGIVVDDLDAAIAFFTELGMVLEGRMTIEAEWAAKTVGLEDTRSEIAMMSTPDGGSRIEFMMYHRPEMIRPEPAAPPANTVGLHRLMFAVDDIEDTVARLSKHGGELIGEITRFEDVFLLVYFRGPAGIVIGLAQGLS
ncbi:MAG: VOC family protein [Hamadaea sp.]|uniref:VOC family protein n=1 Tax=Hamadaea sp. TaxID=2024425 RepID=UPI001827B030|nr:VOC family protein [Hamadaea sp.]NUT21803.1 VOC family protein [Hamadaea sp.]